MAWNPFPRDGETSTWSGKCVNGKAEGDGELVFKANAGIESCVAPLVGGKIFGHAVCEFDDGRIRVVTRGIIEQGQWTGSGGIWSKDASTHFWQNGTWYDDQLAGYGELYSPNMKCTGIWRGDRLDEGHCSYGPQRESPIYEVAFRDGKPTGPNVNTLPNGSRYEAGQHDGKEHGTGVFTDVHGANHKEEFIQGCLFVGDNLSP